MNIVTELNARRHTAAALIERDGWAQGDLVTDDGRHCATGAIMFCAPRNGDESIIRTIQRQRQQAERWNDDRDRTAGEVIAALREDITDTELDEVFGPQWAEIVALMRRAATLTGDEAAAALACQDRVRYPLRDEAFDTAWNVGHSLRLLAVTAVTNASPAAVKDAAAALAVRDRVSLNGFTQERYNLLTAPWRTVVGRVHPDDA